MYSIKNRSMSHIPNSKSNTFKYCSKGCRNVSGWISKTDPLWSYHHQELVLSFEESEISFGCWPETAQGLTEAPGLPEDARGPKQRPCWCILVGAWERCHEMSNGSSEMPHSAPGCSGGWWVIEDQDSIITNSREQLRWFKSWFCYLIYLVFLYLH